MPLSRPDGKRTKDGRRLTWHIEPLTKDLLGPGPAGSPIVLARRGDQAVWAAGGPGLWEFRCFLTPAEPDTDGSPVWRVVGEDMPRITKANALLHAERVEEEISAPGPGGVPVTIAARGDWVCYAETHDGELIFKAFLTDVEYREKFRLAG